VGERVDLVTVTLCKPTHNEHPALALAPPARLPNKDATCYSCSTNVPLKSEQSRVTVAFS
jgi:hypothetical protein